VQVLLRKMGWSLPTPNEILAVLRNGEPIILFPEGEAGQLQAHPSSLPTSRIQARIHSHLHDLRSSIIPAIIVGAEETHITCQIKFTKYLIGTVIPIPLNVIPLPVKWTIKFLPPIDLRSRPVDAMNREKVFEVTRSIRHRLQREIIKELRRRKAGLSGKSSVVDADADLP
jgi:1-acyl-sn-glycerol-3-phosphate acyltransferase